MALVCRCGRSILVLQHLFPASTKSRCTGFRSQTLSNSFAQILHAASFFLGPQDVLRAVHLRTMEDVEHCCVCLELYSHLRLPIRLSSCGHIVCSSCLSTQAISACPLCRTQLPPSTQLVGDEQLLLSIRKQHNTRMPSPTSFPIGTCCVNATASLTAMKGRVRPTMLFHWLQAC
jgi:hypothetical protein